MTDRSFRCSHASEAADEPLFGTASTITNWLLVEHPGPWGEKALHHARLPAGLGDVLRRRERELKIRILLIRRHGRRTGARRSCFAIHTGPDRPWIEWAELEDVSDVATLDLEALGHGASVGLAPTEEPLFAICTHGRRDPCCAERGRPLASALSHAFPQETWESTHIGGDRFAGNLIAFPHGFYFGRVDPSIAVEVATGYVEGRLDLEHLRGRSCRPTDVQAAEHHLRASHALDGVDDVAVTDVSRTGGETFTTFRTSLGSHRVGVRREHGPEERLTCHGEVTRRPPRFELLGIEEL
ncbi:MAG: sucrase ferredoxin [Actinomycetota bacterium]